MIDPRLIQLAARGTVLVVVLLAAAILLRAVVLEVRKVRLRRPLEEARDALAHALTSGAGASEAIALRRLPRRARIELVIAVSAAVAGDGLDVVRRVAADAAVRDVAERWSLSWRWARRVRGLRLGSIVGGVDIARLLEDRHEAVRAAAAVAAPDAGVPASRVLPLLADVPGPRFFAMDAIVRMKPPPDALLAEHLEVAQSEALVPALRVAAAVGGERLGEAAIAKLSHPDEEVRELAARTVAAGGTFDAGEHLIELLGDESPLVRAAAAAGLCRVGHWQAAPELGDALRDGAWVVRQQAGLALRGLGAPGRLVLQAAIAGEDAYASDMARHVLRDTLTGEG